MADFINTSELIGEDNLIDQILQRTITEYRDNMVLTLGTNCLTACTALTTLDLPAAVAFNANALAGCSALKNVNLPVMRTIGLNGFARCAALEKITLPAVQRLQNGSFESCTALRALILPGETICALNSASTMFGKSPIGDGTGYIYVPRALLEGYKAATNWSTFAAQFRALEDYTVDGTITGELDESKI